MMSSITQTPQETRTCFGHGGNVHRLLRRNDLRSRDLLDFSANINPLGPPEWLRATISRSIENLVHYPDPDCYDLTRSIASHLRLSMETIVPANGTTELLYHLPRIVQKKRAVIPVPSYIDYVKVMNLAGMEVEPFILVPENDFLLDTELLSRYLTGDEIVVVGSPNNPTGMVANTKKLLKLAGDFPDTVFVIDEAFLDFVEQGKTLAGCAENILTLNSMTKFFAIPGLRLGYGVFPQKLAETIRRIMPPWTVNTLAQAVGEQAFQDEEYRRNSIRLCAELRHELQEGLSSIADLKIFDSDANYLLLRLLNGTTAAKLFEKLLQDGIVIRVCDNYQGLDESYFRVAVRTREENTALIQALKGVFTISSGKAGAKSRRKIRPLMIQGTSSNAGKSVLVTALCRILLQDGIRVAPFKAQNMSLNSFVTLDGLEMGRAQVVQAQAARLDPDARMNPVLLKPNSDTGSQVIVKGLPVGNMSVMEYVAYKDIAWQAARTSFDELAGDYEAVVLEGAGSPGEVNLKHHDIVNMRMARYAGANVLLVGDIDRGGVYASFIGTMEVLAEWERRLVAGFIVNRFRGQESLLESAHRYVRAHTARDVFGVVPYLHDLGIPEEDSVSFKAGLFDAARPREPHIEIALISLPHISNFTDIEPFVAEPDVYLKVVSHPRDLGRPDAVIIPGSKNVIGDLRALKESGLADALRFLGDMGCEIVGLCGGYQMLGKKVEDPYSIESDKGNIEGLGLLNLVTRLERQKRLVRQRGIHLASACPVYGYEIHHGISNSALEHAVVFEDGTKCGATVENGRIWGTYLHGIFDADSFRRWFIDRLKKRAGLPCDGQIRAPYDLEPAFDRLADTVRGGLDMDRIYALLGL
jgi:cobyric acid synthase CobQ/L-threonine-O-3-phosphate decarboxylase